jgi:hypothetical protein
MPIRSHLNGQRFDPETIRVMGLAYELALISLRLFDRGDIANDVVARKIIELAKAGLARPRAVVRSRVAAMARCHPIRRAALKLRVIRFEVMTSLTRLSTSRCTVWAQAEHRKVYGREGR